MEMDFDKNMNIVRSFRPYINYENTNRSFIIYNPEGGPNYGLYTNNYYSAC